MYMHIYIYIYINLFVGGLCRSKTLLTNIASHVSEQVTDIIQEPSPGNPHAHLA